MRQEIYEIQMGDTHWYFTNKDSALKLLARLQELEAEHYPGEETDVTMYGHLTTDTDEPSETDDSFSGFCDRYFVNED